MRLVEIASAEEQIALFKLITDKVWQSLADQKRQADEQAAQQRRAQAMTGGGRAKRAPTPKPIKPLKPNVMPLPQPKYQSQPPQQAMMDSIPDPMAELRNMAPVRLPSRDIPMDQLQYQQDEEIQPNYVPKPKLTKDYVREYEEAAEKAAQKHEKSKRQVEQIEDAMVDFQLPVLVALLFFIFQIPIVHTVMYRYMSALPIFHSDGNLNFYGFLFKSAMFGSAFWSLQRLIHIIS